MPLQVTMKRTVLILFAVTLVLAIPLAGCGLTHVAGSVLLGGGGLTMALMFALALMGARGVAPAPIEAAVAKVEAQAAVVTAPEPKAAANVEPKAAVAAQAEPKTAKLTKAQRKAAAKARARAAKAKPQAVIVEVAAPEARAPEIEEVAAFFVKAAVKGAEPANDDFAADELAFFAEGENQVMRASDSSPHWQLG
jgi:hypothetical protein